MIHTMIDDKRTLTIERSTSTAHRLAHYDGVCGNVHGHNLNWKVEARINMDGVGEDNMPLDLKDISDAIDQVDHAILLNNSEIDRYVETFSGGQREILKEQLEDLYGNVIWFEEDPTCEHVSRWMAKQIYGLDEAVDFVEVICQETDKYGITARYDEYLEMQEEARDDD